jgi:hypothetical protein
MHTEFTEILKSSKSEKTKKVLEKFKADFSHAFPSGTEMEFTKPIFNLVLNQ